MTSYEIEIGQNKNASRCHCCRNKSFFGHGFVYKNRDAYAVYYVGWSDAHLSRKVSVALAIGDWGDSSTHSDRTCFGLEACEDEDRIHFRVIEPTESPWPDTDLLGPILFREESLANPLLKEVYEIAEQVLREHIALREYFEIPNEKNALAGKH